MSPKITIIKRDSYSFPIHFENDVCLDLDITGYTLFFTVKTLANLDLDDDLAIIQKTVTEHTSPTTGDSVIVLTDEDTNQSAGSYWYDIQLKSPTGNITSCEKGEFIIIQDVTKRTEVPSV